MAGKTRFKDSKVYARAIGLIDEDQNLIELFGEDFEDLDEAISIDTEKDDIIADENLEGTYQQTAALKLVKDGKEYFMPLVSDEG